MKITEININCYYKKLIVVKWFGAIKQETKQAHNDTGAGAWRGPERRTFLLKLRCKQLNARKDYLT